MSGFVIPAPATPSVAVAGSDERFPIRRVFCVGRNYAAHAREISLLVSDAVLAQRALEQPVTRPTAQRGYRQLFLKTVTQADQGVDFDFLRAPSSPASDDAQPNPVKPT